MAHSKGFWGLSSVIITLGWCASTPVLADDYVLGHGLDVGDFNIAGYSNIALDDSFGQRKALLIDDLSLFVAGHINRWINPFMEAELAGPPLIQSNGSGSGTHGSIVLERLYNDILFTDDWTLRGGKMLTPVGEWNLIHAAPLVATSTRPIVTRHSFSEYTTGVSVLYSGAKALMPEVQVYWQPKGEFAARERSAVAREYDDTAGAHLNWPIGLNDKIGASVQYSTIKRTGQTQVLSGLNGKYKFGNFTLESEATFTSIDNPIGQSSRSTEYGGYILGSYAITETISIFSWYELFQPRTSAILSEDILVGASWRPSPPLVWKVEYVGSVSGPSDINRTGYYASFSVLF